jgi:hypothetical protein
MAWTKDYELREGNPPRRRSTPRWALLVFVPWVIAILVGLSHWHDDLELAKRAESTQGTVTGIEPNNHMQVDYEYSVGAAAYSGGQIIAGNTGFGVGEHVHVSFDPDHPQVSTLTDFGEVDSRPIPLLFCAFGGLVSYLFLRRYLRLIESRDEGY